jgi:alpha-glucoside transport system permease protein
VTGRVGDGRVTSWRALLVPAGAVLALVGLVLGMVILLDRQASANIAATIFEWLGNTGEATALRRGGGDGTLAKLILTVVAIVVGVGGTWLFYAGLNAVVMTLGQRRRQRLLPWVFVGPALALLAIYLVVPVVFTIILSFTEEHGIGNYADVLGDPGMISVLTNNLIWLVVGVTGAVGFGLLIAGLLDRVKRESLAKTFVFLPLAISLVGASVIWRFVYTWRPAGQPQYGLLNAIVTGLGFDPIAWTQTPGLATYALIVILIWLQTGFAMVVLSAAIKGVPTEVTEAARLDGATERQLFFRIIIPSIKGSLVMVTVTTAIVVLKVFDIVFVMTGGNFDTDVVANQMYRQMFMFRNYGQASVLAVILFVAVLPMLIINVRNIRRQGLAA